MNLHALRIMLTAAAVVLAAQGVMAGPIWFDETGGQNGYNTFGELQQAYDQFFGVSEGVVDLNGLSEGTKLSQQYRDRYGVSFLNSDGGRYSSYSGVRKEAGAIAEHITGYDGTYMPNGDNVYVKFNNDDATKPFTIVFDDPVAAIGAFVGMGVQGAVHTLSVSVYDIKGELLGQHQVNSWLWEANSSKQNYESFFGMQAGEAVISRVEILNDAKKNFANALLLDNLEFTSTPIAGMMPEPTTLLFLLGGGGVLLLSRARAISRR